MAESLRTTPLTAWHRAHGARTVPFAGFEMPVQYAGGIQEEVRAVRQRTGLFDLCHMGRLVLRGPDRVAAADHVLSQNVAEGVPLGAIRYSLICTPDGTVIDDVLVYKDADVVHVVINASGREVDDDRAGSLLAFLASLACCSASRRRSPRSRARWCSRCAG